MKRSIVLCDSLVHVHVNVTVVDSIYSDTSQVKQYVDVGVW